MPENVDLPNKALPVVKWDRLGRVTEPTDRARRNSKNMAHVKVSQALRVDKFLDRIVDEAIDGCCQRAEALADTFDDVPDDCCARNYVVHMMLLASGRAL